MLISKTEFLNLLDRLRSAVAKDDSYEGSLQYTIEGDGFDVGAFVRIGNREGQGGAMIVEKGEKTSCEGCGTYTICTLTKDDDAAPLCSDCAKDDRATKETVKPSRPLAGQKGRNE